MNVKKMSQFFSDEEYENAFTNFEGIRRKIAQHLKMSFPLKEGTIMDLLSGHGFMTAEIANMYTSCKVFATGLINDFRAFMAFKAYSMIPASFWNGVDYIICDVTDLPFKNGYFDLVTNFLGLEDVVMTCGNNGLLSTISEMVRVTKKNMPIQITIVEYGDTPEEQLAKEIWESIGLNAVFLDYEFYVDAFEEHGLRPIDEVTFKTRKKMTPEQATKELVFACEEAPKIFARYGVKAIAFDELISQFQDRLRKHGMAYYPNIRTIIFQ